MIVPRGGRSRPWPLRRLHRPGTWPRPIRQGGPMSSGTSSRPETISLLDRSARRSCRRISSRSTRQGGGEQILRGIPLATCEARRVFVDQGPTRPIDQRQPLRMKVLGARSCSSTATSSPPPTGAIGSTSGATSLRLSSTVSNAPGQTHSLRVRQGRGVRPAGTGRPCSRRLLDEGGTAGRGDPQVRLAEEQNQFNDPRRGPASASRNSRNAGTATTSASWTRQEGWRDQAAGRIEAGSGHTGRSQGDEGPARRRSGRRGDPGGSSAARG